MTGYWPSSFLCLWNETKSRSINLQEKEQGQYAAFLNVSAWLIKDLLYDFWRNFSCRIQQVVTSGQESSILPTWVANHSV